MCLLNVISQRLKFSIWSLLGNLSYNVNESIVVMGEGVVADVACKKGFGDKPAIFHSICLYGTWVK